MMSNEHPIAYFLCNNNNMFEAQERTCLLSSSYAYSQGKYIPKNNIRRSLALFCVRSLPKHSWINDNNRFLGRD